MRALLLLVLFLPLAALAQFSDNFADGDFTTNPTWTGNTTKFIVNAAHELQLYENPTAEGTSFLSTPSQAFYNASWEFLVRMSFNPSATNYCDVYIVSNNADLNAVTNGYFVRLGTTVDDVCLYRKDAASSVKIIDGTDGILNTTAVNVMVRVTRDFDGNWTLETDILGGTDYSVEGTVFDASYFSSTNFGIKCIYTSTRSQHFFFDNIIVTGEPFVDDVKPELLSYSAIDANHFVMVWNEALDASSTLVNSNFSVDNGIGEPSNVSFYNSHPSKLILEFANPFISPNNYILQYQGVNDLNFNSIEPAMLSFCFIEIESGMVVVNEIMADPNPVVGLPDAEYVELYNTTDCSINIAEWTYTIGTTTKTLPAYQLAANEYLILCHDTMVSTFSEYGNVLGIASFPQITNSGQTIVIKDNNSQEIDRVTYSIAWYGDGAKEDGGWSLEKIDPQNTCSPSTNWIASNSELGGTPGSLNSVYAINEDNVPPFVLGVSVMSGNELNVVFSEPVDTTVSMVFANYVLEPLFGNPVYAYSNPANTAVVTLQFAASFSENVHYSLSVSNISDWCSNMMEPQSIDFILYTANDYDVIISEIMADPDPVVLLPDAEYIELYNRTNFDMDLSNWSISAGTTVRTLPLCIIPAKSYLVLCHKDKASLFNGIENVVGVASFPSLTNGGATLTLKSKEGKVINTVTYSDKWYRDAFKKNGGFSLEIIDLNNPCEGENNWNASKDISGGTVGRQNSVNGINPDIYLPYPVAAEVIAPDSLVLYFNETLKKEFAENPNHYSVETFGNPVWVSAAEPGFSVISMKFNEDFVRGRVYYVNISDSVRDCANNMVAVNTSFRFGVADSIIKNDIVINEILFNPLSGGSDFVELYNNSDRLLDLKLLWFVKKDDAGMISDSYQISKISRLLLPGEYCAISENIKFLTDNYFTPYLENLFKADKLTSMADDIGNIFVTDRFLNVIDSVYYTDKQQYKLLASKDGVSLERINFDRSSADKTNWHSASETVGFATPGYKNSQYSSEIVTETTITLNPEVFSPDNDGVDDRLNIIYKLDQPGYTATIAVYSADGKFITYIVNNEMLAVEGTLIWDGFDNGNNICPIGIYVVYVEMFNLTGNKIVEKHTTVLSKRSY